MTGTRATRGPRLRPTGGHSGRTGPAIADTEPDPGHEPAAPVVVMIEDDGLLHIGTARRGARPPAEKPAGPAPDVDLFAGRGRAAKVVEQPDGR